MTPLISECIQGFRQIADAPIEDVIRLMVGSLQHVVADIEPVVTHWKNMELRGITGWTDRGLVLGEACVPSLTSPVIALGASPQGFLWRSRTGQARPEIDGATAYLVYLIVAPTEQLRLQFLAKGTRLFSKPEIVHRIAQAQSLDEARELVRNLERALPSADSR